jgi:hypothetical protein
MSGPLGVSSKTGGAGSTPVGIETRVREWAWRRPSRTSARRTAGVFWISRSGRPASGHTPSCGSDRPGFAYSSSAKRS